MPPSPCASPGGRWWSFYVANEHTTWKYNLKILLKSNRIYSARVYYCSVRYQYVNTLYIPVMIQTTVRLTDELHTRAKIEAVLRRMTLNELFVDAIEKAVPAPQKSK